MGLKIERQTTLPLRIDRALGNAKQGFLRSIHGLRRTVLLLIINYHRRLPGQHTAACVRSFEASLARGRAEGRARASPRLRRTVVNASICLTLEPQCIPV